MPISEGISGGPPSYIYGSSPQIGGMPTSYSPPNLGAASTATLPAYSSAPPPPAVTATVSTAASWSNDLVLADLIVNSHTIFDVLPKLPSRTRSMMVAEEQALGRLSLGPSNMNPLGGSGGLRVESPSSISQYGNSSRPFSSSRKSSASSLGATPTSPMEGGGQQQILKPRSDSLGPMSGALVP